MNAATVTTAVLTCPECSAQHAEAMPANACLFFYTCPTCQVTLRPLAGDCCVFCSYSDQVCPPKQSGDACC
ncbi:MAG TPA: GDCCVxC domain-containing (seleno)protein [Gaiellaceae bacterium]|nr:GDCCVxC domain-containing (seleno)protein [Gaiellaceae bacterium]